MYPNIGNGKDRADRMKNNDRSLYSVMLQNEELRDTLGKMDLVLAQIVESIVWTDSDGKIKWCNGSFDDLCGKLRLFILGNSLSELLPLDCSESCKEIHPCDKLLRDKADLDTVCRFKRGDQAFDLEIQGRAFISREGERSAVFVIRDITRRNLLEAQLRQAQKLESIGSMAAGITHEINTPVHYVGENLRFIEESISDMQKLFLKLLDCSGKPITNDDWPEINSLIESIDLEFVQEEISNAVRESLKGISQVANIVKSVKEFAHPGEPAMELTNLNEAIESTILLSANECKYVADVSSDLCPDLPLVPCIGGKLNQVFLNLIVNAAHAIGDNLRDKKSGNKGQIEVKTHSKGDYVEVEISDTGPGIPDEIHGKLFEPFFTTKEAGRGTGQGLAIAKKIVEQDHHGELSFETQLGKGTRFLIRLPVSQGL